MIEQLYTSKEVMKALKISRATLDRWIKKEAFPVHKVSTHELRFKADEIKDWIANRNLR